MAQGKKSVLLYCDIIHTVEPLTDEEAGRLFKHYLRYINDLNPCSEDRLTALLFEPIKQNLKRDLKKWESKSLKNKENAKMRWDANACERIQDDANHADKDTVTVTVTDTVKDKVKVKDTKATQPALEEFLGYAKEKLNGTYLSLETSLKLKYEAWAAAGWKVTRGGKLQPIHNWKTTLLNTIPYLKPSGGGGGPGHHVSKSQSADDALQRATNELIQEVKQSIQQHP